MITRDSHAMVRTDDRVARFARGAGGGWASGPPPGLLRWRGSRAGVATRGTAPLTGFYPVAASLGLLEAVEAALEAGAISAFEATEWLDSLEWASRTRRRFGRPTRLTVAGRTPRGPR